MNLMRYSWKYLRGDGLWDTLRHYRGSPLTGSPNRCISDFADTSSKFLAMLGISDMPRTLSEIANPAKRRF